jgi:hypothetical protein
MLKERRLSMIFVYIGIAFISVVGLWAAFSKA